MAAWRATLLLACALTACNATTSYGYGYGYGYGYHHAPGGDHDPRVGPSMSIVAKFETGGIRGEICFFQEEPGAPVKVTVKLQGLERFEPQEYDWEIHEYPVRFAEYPDFPCSEMTLGDVYTPTECPENSTSTCRYGDLGERLGRLKTTSEPQMFTDNVLDLFGHITPIGRSILLRHTIPGREDPFTCANIEYQGISLQTLRAGFNDELNGDVIFRRQSGRPGTTLHVDLVSACPPRSFDLTGVALEWSLRDGSCDGPIFGNDTHEDEIHHGAFDDCSPYNPRGCPPGDLTTKCGPIQPEAYLTGVRYRAFCNDDQLGLIPLSSIQDTYLVFSLPNGTIVDCQPWHPVNQLCARVTCTKRPRLYMDILFFQYDPGDRTHVRSYITGLDQEAAYLEVREQPVTNKLECDAGGRYDKPRGALIHGAAPGVDPTGDVLPVGTLQFKTTDLRDQQSLVKQDTTSWLPLFGPFTIIGRSIALVGVDGRVLMCCNIEPVTDPSPELITSILSYQDAQRG